MEFHDRLREERERLGYTQVAFAALTGAAKNSQLNWEKGHSFPNAATLATWAKVGLDVSYVVTGKRSVPIEETMNAKEQALLDVYRHVPTQQRKFIEDAVTMAASSLSNDVA